MGCMNKVFRGEIDLELFEQAERTRHGFGGVKMTGVPLPQCRTTVERAYDGCGEPFDCVNPRFFRKPGSRRTRRSTCATSSRPFAMVNGPCVAPRRGLRSPRIPPWG